VRSLETPKTVAIAGGLRNQPGLSDADAPGSAPGQLPHPRHPTDLVVVAARLPVSWDDRAGGWATAPGGVARALTVGLRGRHATWVGWLGRQPEDATPAPEHVRTVDLRAVDLSEDDQALWYRGYCNEGLWPLMHQVPVEPRVDGAMWRSYVEVNARFADMAAREAAMGGKVWVHDYQLMLVPRMLRRLRPDLRVGYFHHIPMPPAHVLLQLPGGRDILEGLQAADVLGFQTAVDADQYSRAVTGRDEHVPAVRAVGAGQATRRPEIGVFPISVDVEELRAVAAAPQVRQRAEKIRAWLGGRTVVLGIERLDYTKGIPVRLEALRTLLQAGEITSDEVVYVQIATPSREGVRGYKQAREEVEAGVEQLLTETEPGSPRPVEYLYRSLSREDVVAMYLAADVLLVTPLRDGMNLVAKEYVAVRQDSGALVLSRGAGAAAELVHAWPVDPQDTYEVASALLSALRCSPQERSARMTAMAAQVRRHDLARWTEDFLGALDAVRGHHRAREGATHGS
jgi:trehalose 6-phosphate synthase